ncbi:MAG: N-acetylglucosamine-6-phosphate deacetylase, partial [Candidatus Pristimantibacillus sp.]
MNSNHNQSLITQVKIVLEDRIAEGSVIIENGIIKQIIENGSPVPAATEQLTVIDGQGGWLLPGFIDIHVHGGFGGDFM